MLIINTDKILQRGGVLVFGIGERSNPGTTNNLSCSSRRGFMVSSGGKSFATYDNYTIEHSASIVLSAVAAAIGNARQIQINGNGKPYMIAGGASRTGLHGVADATAKLLSNGA